MAITAQGNKGFQIKLFNSTLKGVRHFQVTTNLLSPYHPGTLRLSVCREAAISAHYHIIPVLHKETEHKETKTSISLLCSIMKHKFFL